MNAILDEAATQERSVAITMLDLSNAFGSISHINLSDILLKYGDEVDLIGTDHVLPPLSMHIHSPL